MKSQQWLPLLLTATTISPSDAFCTLSDILSNNQSCLTPISEEGSFVSFPPFELQLQINNDSAVIDESSLGFGVEYYLNFTLGQFDDDEGFDDGGFAYAIVDDVSTSTSSVWEVSARAYYNLSPGGWIFSSVPTEMELMRRVEIVIEEQLDDNGRAKFGTVMETLFDGLNVVGVGVTYTDSTGSPSLGPASTSTNAPTENPTGLSTDAPTENPTTLPPSLTPTETQFIIPVTNRPTDSPQSSTPLPSQHIMHSTQPTIQQSGPIKTLAPSISSNDALVETLATLLPTFIPEDENNGLTGTQSPSSRNSASQSDHFGLASENVGNGHSSTVYQTNTTTETHNKTQEEVNKVLLTSPTSSNNNKSTIIASVTLTTSFLLLLVASVALLIKRHGIPRRKEKFDEMKDRPLAENDLCGFHSGVGEVQDVECGVVSDGDDAEFVDERTVCARSKRSAAAVTPTRLTATKSALPGEVMTESNIGKDHQQRSETYLNGAAAAKSTISNNAANLSNEQSHTSESNHNDTSTNELSTSTNKEYDPSFVINHYDEEKIAKKEMARELFLTKEEVRENAYQNDDNFPETDFNTGDLGFAEQPFVQTKSIDALSQDTTSFGVCYQDNQQDVHIESSPSLEYSTSDAPSIKTPYDHKNTTQLQTTTTNLISPSSLPDRRNSFGRQLHRPDPPEFTDKHDHPDGNDATVITNDESLHSIDDEDSSAFFPELNSSWNEVFSDAACLDHNTKWNRCLADCAPTSLKDLITPMHENEDCEEENELAVAGDKWLNRALCGRGCNGNNISRRASPTCSIGQPEFENDWDFDDAEDEGDIKSGEDAFGV